MTAFRSSSDVIARVTVVAFAFGVAACEVGDDPQPLSHMVAVEGTVDYTIAAGTSFYIDRSYSVGHLTVNGRLLCQPGVTTPITITAVPEASTWAMMLSGLAVAGAIARRRKPD